MKKENFKNFLQWQSLFFAFAVVFLFLLAVPNVFAASIGYAGNFTEATANDGSVTGSRVITLTGDTFVDPITLNTHLTVTNVPSSLTAVATRDSATQITITLTGNADSHANANDVANLTITFLDGAFVTEATASNVTAYTDANGIIDFNDQASIVYAGNFTEATANDGSVTGSRTATLTSDTFVNAGGTLTETTHFTLTNKPAGLTAVMNVNGGGTVATLTFTGNATSHLNADDVANLTITFLDGAFTNTTLASNVTNYTDANGTIDFNDQASLAYSGNFTEDTGNNGGITGSRVITLTSDTFVSPITLTTHLNVTNVPAGLTAVITRDSTTQLTLTLTGDANNHLDANDVANLTITFLDGAFTNTAAASNVTNYINAAGTIDFSDPVGGSSFLPTPSSGGGTTSTFVDMAEESSMLIVDSLGKNIILYINSLVNFQLEGDLDNSYTAQVQNLDMMNGQIDLLFNNGQVITALVGDLKQVDLNGDLVADISIKYNELAVNRIDLTFTKLLVGEEITEEIIINENDGLLLKEFGKSAVYILEDGKKRPILNEAVFNINGFNWGDISEVTDLSQYPLGEMLVSMYLDDHVLANGDLVKEFGDPRVYILENGLRRHILDEAVFNAHGFDWYSIYEVSDLSMYSLWGVLN